MERMQAPHSYVPRARILMDAELVRVWKATETFYQQLTIDVARFRFST